MPPIVTQIAIYQVVTSVAQPSVGTALDYFYTAPVECVLDGPHFTYSYYISYAGLAGRLISLVGVIVYQFFLSKLKFRVVLLVPTILQSIAGKKIRKRNFAPNHAIFLTGTIMEEKNKSFTMRRNCVDLGFKMTGEKNQSYQFSPSLNSP